MPPRIHDEFSHLPAARAHVLRHPQKAAARRATMAAIKSGKLVRQPCEGCGRAKVQAHHSDYSKPLEITWLCQHCHSAEHRRLNLIALSPHARRELATIKEMMLWGMTLAQTAAVIGRSTSFVNDNVRRHRITLGTTRRRWKAHLPPETATA